MRENMMLKITNVSTHKNIQSHKHLFAPAHALRDFLLFSLDHIGFTKCQAQLMCGTSQTTHWARSRELCSQQCPMDVCMAITSAASPFFSTVSLPEVFVYVHLNNYNRK